MRKFIQIFHCSADLPKPPVKVGDVVWTQFFRNDAQLARRVTAVRPARGRCNSGWWVEAVDDAGLVLSCDSSWFVAPMGGHMQAVHAN